jgi:hypothetical protein
MQSMLQPRDDEIVEDPAGLVRQETVTRTSLPEIDQIAGRERLERRGRAWAPHYDLPHVRDVE